MCRQSTARTVVDVKEAIITFDLHDVSDDFDAVRVQN